MTHPFRTSVCGIIGKSLVFGVFLAVLIHSLPGWGTTVGGRSPARISVLMATGVPGSTYYQIGLGMASFWTTKLQEEGIRVSAAVSEGSRENIQAIRISDADLILAEEYLCSEAYEGTGLYKGRPVSDLRSVAALWPDVVHILIRSDKLATGTMQDLAGSTFATGLSDSGSRLTAEALVRSLKPGKRKVRMRYLSYAAAVDALRKNTVQAFEITGGMPIPLVTTLFLEKKPPLALLGVTDAQLSALQAEYQTRVYPIIIPAGTYSGQEKPIRTVAETIMLAVTASLDTQVVYELTRTLYENPGDLAKLHPACSAISLENALKGLKVPLHEGAYRYYKERKMVIPDHLLPEVDPEG